MITWILVASGSVMGTGCGQDEGIVELNWVFVDRNQQPVYPGETLTSCSFSGRLAEGEDARDYGLHVELRVCDAACAEACSDACLIHEVRFSCQTARGTARVPAVDDSTYTFQTKVVAIADGGEGEDSACYCTLRDECALTPGPRARSVRPGLVTDLQVYQIVLPTLALSPDRPIGLNLAACCDPSPGCP